MQPVFDNRPPKVSLAIYKRVAVAGALIVALTAASVATASLLRVKQTVDILHHYGHVAKTRKGTITKAQAGQPQTILLVGSDKRFGWRNDESRSDTMMLLRLDPDQQATAVMSVPRDLKVQIPGHGLEKINAAYSYGGIDLVARTIKSIMPAIKINHTIEVNFKGFREAVDFVGCVYADVDRRYYHSNVGLPPAAQYAEIDIQPGYQKLCGQKALDYVRFRHEDNDFVRAARQQDFLRQAKEQVGTSTLVDDLDPLTKIFAKATETDEDLQSVKGILRLLKLAVYSTGHPLREIHFPQNIVNGGATTVRSATGQVTTSVGESYVTASPEQLSEVAQQFLHAKRSDTQPEPKKAATTTGKKRKKRGKKASAATTNWADYGLIDADKLGEQLVSTVAAKGDAGFPIYYPQALTGTGVYAQKTSVSSADNPRVYTIRDRADKPHQAYRIVVQNNRIDGQYYGVEGTTWKTPPILRNNGEVHRMRGRTYRAYYDGRKIRAVAWTTPHAVYWVSNTLSLDLSNKQMLGLARSLKRVGS